MAFPVPTDTGSGKIATLPEGKPTATLRGLRLATPKPATEAAAGDADAEADAKADADEPTDPGSTPGGRPSLKRIK